MQTYKYTTFRGVSELWHMQSIVYCRHKCHVTSTCAMSCRWRAHFIARLIVAIILTTMRDKTLHLQSCCQRWRLRVCHFPSNISNLIWPQQMYSNHRMEGSRLILRNSKHTPVQAEHGTILISIVYHLSQSPINQMPQRNMKIATGALQWSVKAKPTTRNKKPDVFTQYYNVITTDCYAFDKQFNSIIYAPHQIWP